ncbi:APC family permease [Mycobacterium sp.]|uniref:APC family permease n=1 Tax=Mycobacterium sp. TaxID=1785 RepID=UPI003A8A6C0D
MTHPAGGKLGFRSVVMLGINAIIGAGIFLTPGAVIKLAGPLAPLAYILAGLFAGTMAMVFATAARYVTTNGASYAYTNAAFGRRLAIYVGVTHAVIASIAWGVLATLFVSTLLKVAFPQHDWSIDTDPFSIKTLTFLGFVAVLLVINLFGNRVIRWANGISTLGKVFALAVFIAGGVWIIVTEHVNNYGAAGSSLVHHPQPYALFGFIQIGQNNTPATLVLATMSALYAFTGFESIANAAEEMTEPNRNLPKAIPIVILAVGTIYVLAVAVAMLLGSDRIVASHDTVKLAAAIGDDTFRTVVVLGALVSMFGINVAASFGAPRLWTALADTGVLPTRLSKKNRFGVPMAAFAVTASLALAFPLALHFDNDHLTGLAVIARFIQFIIVPLAVMRLARNRAGTDPAITPTRFTRTVLPVAAVTISAALAVSFDYRTILLVPDGGPNYFSIALVVTAFVVVPTAAYLYYFRSADRSADRSARIGPAPH